MTFSFHLTDKCNLNCKYCFEKNKTTDELNFEDIKKVIDREDSTENIEIDFFGGEPLIKKDLVYEVVSYTKQIAKKKDIKVSYSITTNGILLDKEFISFAKDNNFFIGISIDGNEESHNKNRVNYNGQGSFEQVLNNAKILLRYMPYSYALAVVTKNNYKQLYENVEYIFKIGFKCLIVSLDYSADWHDEDLEILKEQYKKLSELYYNKTKNGDYFFLLPFDTKINMHANKKSCIEHRKLGSKHINIGADKNIYPCVQFVGKKDYIIGNCDTGIDNQKRLELIKNMTFDKQSVCSSCTYNNRCSHACCCTSILSTGEPDGLSPFVCETERMIIELSDKVAEKLYAENNKIFLDKTYQDLDLDRFK